MIGAYASAALVVAASLVLGRAVLALSGRGESTLLAGPVGLAVVLTMSGIAIHLPGRATAVAISLTLVTLLSLTYLLWGRGPGDPRPDARSMDAELAAEHGRERIRAGERPALAESGLTLAGAAPALAAAAVVILAASIPYAVNGRFGILGVGLVNDDMASHLAIADWLWTHVGREPGLIGQGYPLGPHGLAAGLASGLGTGLIEAFAGIVLAVPVLTALTAAGALAELRPAARAAVSALVALPYLAAAYLAQEAFKEPIEALFVLGFALLLPATRSARDSIPLGVIAAGSVYVYSFPGLAWLAGTALIYAVWTRRATWAAAAAAAGLMLVFAAPDLGRLIDFTGFRAFGSSSISEGLGNLRHQLSPLEALGIWPTSEFRLSAADSSHTLAFYAGALVAAAALAVGLPRWLRRHGPAVPAALAAAAVVYVGALAFGTVYTSAKALAIASPLVLLVGLGGLLDRPAPRARTVLAVALVAGAALSSFLVLRQAPVGPDDHRVELAELRPLVQGQDVLFLARDNFVVWELRGARPFVAVRNYYDRDYVKPNLDNPDVFRKFDFDSVRPATLDRFRYVITTRAAYASGPPPEFEPVRETADFVLWRRTGPVGPRRTLDEGAAPGAVLRCPGRSRRAAGTATVFRRRPVAGAAWAQSATVEGSGVARQTLRVPRGRWEVSIQYDSTQSLHVAAPGLDATLPANLDYRGSVPYFPAGVVTVRHAGPVEFQVGVGSAPLLGRLLGTKPVAHLGAIAVSPAGSNGPLPGEAESGVPLARACGRYVDWIERP